MAFLCHSALSRCHPTKVVVCSVPLMVLSLPGSAPKSSDLPLSLSPLLSQKTSDIFPVAPLRCLYKLQQPSLVWKFEPCGILLPIAQGLWDWQQALENQMGKPPNPSQMLLFCNHPCGQPACLEVGMARRATRAVPGVGIRAKSPGYCHHKVGTWQVIYPKQIIEE